jgi:uncharacterized protein involved in outer membrane biogenesis
MIKKIVLVVIAVLAVGALALVLYARSMLASDNVRATLEPRLTAQIGEPVRIASASARIFPRVALDLGNVTVGDPPEVSVERVSISTGLRGLFSRRVEDAEVTLSGGRVVLPAALALTTIGDARSEDGENGAPGLTIDSVRAIALRDVEVVADSSSVRVDSDSALEGGRLTISRLTVESPRTRFEASGTVTTATRHGRFDVVADSLDIDELLTIAAGLTSGDSDGRSAPVKPMRLELEVAAKAGRFAGYDFSDCKASLNATPGRVNMPALAFQIFGGSFAGSLDADTSAARPKLRLRGKADAMDVSRLAATAGRPGSITGRLAATIDLAAGGADASALVRSTMGTADAVVTNGVIPGLEMVRAIVLAFGKPSGAPPPGSGSAFSRLAGHFTVQNGVLRSNNVTFASRDFDMGGRASLAVPNGAVDAHVDVVLSRELTAQAGTDLRRYAASDGRVIVPAQISGTLNQPTVTVDVAAAMRRALENELKRRTRGWLDDLIKRKKGGG